MTSEQVRLDREELTALFLSLAGIEIQKNIGPNAAVSTRKLFKVLANCVWDWSFLPDLSKGHLRVSEPGDLVWVPHRFGALGLVCPSINYQNVKLQYGLFADLSDLLDCGVYSKYGVRKVRSQKGRLELMFPLFMSYEQLAHSRVSEIDRHLWPQLAGVYSQLDDWAIDAMASCRNAVATVQSLWAQLVFWNGDLLQACELLQELPEPTRSAEDKEHLRAAASGAAAAMSHFSRKVRYWEERERAIMTVRAASVGTELRAFIPVSDFGDSEAANVQLGKILGIRDVLEAASLIFRGLLGQLHLMEETDMNNPESAQPALTLLRNRMRSNGLKFRELAGLWFTDEVKSVADYIENLLTQVVSLIEGETGLRIEDKRGHYRSFISVAYPLSQQRP